MQLRFTSLAVISLGETLQLQGAAHAVFKSKTPTRKLASTYGVSPVSIGCARRI